ncbi:DNA cytosine methyltransferase [Cytobacillus purgationiresistens]|uniref:DNA (cytosine-5-)-methyltransferase n=1 Tax=Cytobacillus purgationiresistens TaxID=863449 RepID=A0ABU0ANJ3_9BACI|nr:DNA cytosine methyltransferase [Cytobacillus purgationiresistens]MDQ0272753.1 DNA (cytosine-5)-methyltransferase 1 [Cytobacillus purgationiresistens]
MIIYENAYFRKLFDGIGVFPLAASRYGITPIWASEVEKAPISITKHHFPNMLHIGDITKINGGKIPPVDVITFGSPCQNLSKIGKREGLAGGGQSNLFYQALRIIEEMRCATNDVYPVIAVWENVMGAFSSNNRMDFKAVLKSFTNTKIPMPASGVWANVGMVRGNNIDVCWRLLDAQYWGRPTLAQRRRRIFLVADFRGDRAREILFKARNLQSFPATCGKDRLSSPSTSGRSSEKTRRNIPIVRPFQERRMRSAAKDKNETGFIGSFGKTGDPFPTLLAGSVNIFSFWYEGKEKEGFIRQLTPLECERLMGLPEASITISLLFII